MLLRSIITITKTGLLITFCLSLLILQAQNIALASTFEQVKEAVFTKPYAKLPTYKVNKKLFGKSGNNEQNQLLSAAKRTLNDPRDLIDFPQGQKLLQANGICFVGEWIINEDNDSGTVVNDYTGLFQSGVSVPVIVRASVALSGTLQKNKRAFGLAIKFFDDESTSKPSLNAFVLNSFGGVITKHVLDLSLDNQPTLGSLPKWGDLGTALRLRKDLEKADREQGAEKPRFAFRPITHLASYQTSEAVSSPQWLRLKALTTERIDEDDFRDELRIEHYANQKIVYSIEVADDSVKKKSKAQWQLIGNITLNQSITSAACDQNLHFMHPSL